MVIQAGRSGLFIDGEIILAGVLGSGGICFKG
jgi:hypothetical protein